MKIPCSIEIGSDTNDYGTESPIVKATCPKCGRETESWGDSEEAVKRALVLLSEECVYSNFYVAENGEDGR